LRYNYHQFSTLPAPFDIVWCRFPYNENPSEPSDDFHPGLIRQAFADQDGNPWVTVVYGTSVNPFKQGNQYFSVSKVSEMDNCGLKCATRFCLERDAQLPWSQEYFEILPGQPTPIIGNLSEYGQRLLQMQYPYHQRDCQNAAEAKG
jgi:hypothetical protein